jgi:endonuclease III related protein
MNGKRPTGPAQVQSHKAIRRMYRALEKRFGDLKWWPAKTLFEVVVGTILTQNTSWANVERAIKDLRSKGLLSPQDIIKADARTVESAVRCTGYFRQKASRLKAISRFFEGGIPEHRRKEVGQIREELLLIKGVGPETADSIILYALKMPVFVVDAYTRRIFARHGIIGRTAKYDQVRCLVEGALGRDVKVLNQFHALLVETAKLYCKKKAGLCDRCPMGGNLERGKT